MSGTEGSRGPSRRTRLPPGSAPGSLAAAPGARRSEFRAIAYDADHIEETSVDVTDIPALRHRSRVLWIDVDGIGDAAALADLGQQFGLHPLALEDVVHLGQRAKLDVYAGHLFLVMHMPRGDRSEQLGLFLGEDFVVTIQEEPGDPFELVRGRLRGERVRIRGSGPDYLAYALLDAVVDSYFPVVDAQSDRLGQLEESLEHADPEDLARELLAVRRQLLAVRREVAPMRDVLGTLARDESGLVHDDTRLFLRDCQDHALRLVESVEAQRELASGLRDTHLSLVSHRMNEIMKVLTIIATIFIPLSFVAGLYGMNFDPGVSGWNMPELSLPYGYPAALLLMAAMALGMLVFFRRRGWLGTPSRSDGEG